MADLLETEEDAVLSSRLSKCQITDLEAIALLQSDLSSIQLHSVNFRND